MLGKTVTVLIDGEIKLIGKIVSTEVIEDGEIEVIVEQLVTNVQFIIQLPN